MKRISEYLMQNIPPHRKGDGFYRFLKSSDPLVMKLKYNMMCWCVCFMVFAIAGISTWLSSGLGFEPTTNVVPTIKSISLWLAIFFWGRHCFLTTKYRNRGGS